MVGSSMQTLVQPMAAIFEQGGATQDEVNLALERFQFKGLYEGENPARRISIYDTDEQARQHAWSDELKAEIEALLDRDQGPNYFRVESPKATLPWPSYDETPAAKVMEVARTIGVDPSTVLAYERENQNRPSVLKALEPKQILVEA